MYTEIVREPIDPRTVLERVGDAADGAVVFFLGVVRNHAEGRGVTGVLYDAYDEMAAEVLSAIVVEASERWGTDRIAAVHRVGALDVGEVSVAVAVSSAHRADAYEASRYVIEGIKQRLPVWKKERYVEGEEAWVKGAEPPTPAPTGDQS
jgi:molybdopterin synthase catalytic subunit